MDPVRAKLKQCFSTVFPDLPEDQIEAASQDTVAEWDSVAAITLINVIEDEFGVQLDLDRVADLSSFDQIANHLNELVSGAAAGQ